MDFFCFFFFVFTFSLYSFTSIVSKNLNSVAKLITKQRVDGFELVDLKKTFEPIVKRMGILLLYGNASYLVALTLFVLWSSFFGFSLTTNYVSDLGSINIIPFPLVHDLICVFGGLVSLPVNFFTRKKLQTVYKSSKHSTTFVELGFALGVIGNAGYALLGVFSLDRAGPGQFFHGVAALLGFGGSVVSIFFYSLNIFLSHKCRLRNLGLFGLITPTSLLFLYCLFPIPLLEWLLMTSILLFLLLLDCYVFKV